jgi:hypothetical protein
MGIGVKFKMTRDRQKTMIRGLVELI